MYTAVTIPPVLVDDGRLVLVPHTRPAWNGPITLGSTIWIGTSSSSFTVSGDVGWQMYRSDDNGISWTRAGLLRTINYPVVPYSFIWDGSDGFLLLEYNESTSTAHISRYSTATQSWTNDYISSFSTANNFVNIACLSKLSTGKIICAYTRGGTSAIPYYRFWNGTSWGSETRLGVDIVGHGFSSSIGTLYVGIGPMIVDDVDITHLFIWTTLQDAPVDANNISKLFYCKVDSSGVLWVDPTSADAVRTLADSLNFAGPFRYLTWEDGLFRSGQLFLTEDHFWYSNRNHAMGVLNVAVPSTLAGNIGTINYTQLHSSTLAGDQRTYEHPFFFHSQNNLYPILVLGSVNEDPAPGVMQRFESDDGGATWNELLYWDPSALPPSIPSADTYDTTEGVWGTITSGSRLDFYVAALVAFPSESTCSVILAGHSGFFGSTTAFRVDGTSSFSFNQEVPSFGVDGLSRFLFKTSTPPETGGKLNLMTYWI